MRVSIFEENINTQKLRLAVCPSAVTLKLEPRGPYISVAAEWLHRFM